jgi:MFS family permease
MKLISKLYDSRRTNRVGFRIGLVGWLLATGIAVGAGSALNYLSPFLSDKGLSQDALNRLWRLALIPALIIGIIAWVLLIITRKAASASPDPALKPRFHSFLIGFVGWFVINSVLAMFLGGVILGPGLLSGPSTSSDYTFICPGALLLLLSIVIMIIAAFKRSMIALGIVAAYAANIAITLVIGVGYASICGVPFYSNAFPPFR